MKIMTLQGMTFCLLISNLISPPFAVASIKKNAPALAEVIPPALVKTTAPALVKAVPPSLVEAVPPWWQTGVAYEIFVRSFQDSNGDGIGDLNGITQRLTELKSLGVDVLWLTPIFKSPSYHGYDTTDYLSINPDFGTMDDFDALVKAAHAKGMKIVLDVAVNHTSNQHPWFKQSGSRYMWQQNPSYNPEHWFELKSKFYYATFSENLPDLNWYSKEVRHDVKNIFTFWAERGADGFRLDAARYYAKGPNGESDTPETHKIIGEFAQATRAKFPNIYFVGEIWSDHSTIASYLEPHQLDSAFDFPTSYALIRAVLKGKADEWTRSLKELAATTNDNMERTSPFLTNHDMIRVGTQMAGNLDALKLAAVGELVVPGMPYLYYGEEIGMMDDDAQSSSNTGKKIKRHRSDLAQRTPMRWSSAHGFGFTDDKPWLNFSSAVEPSNVTDAMANSNSLWRSYQRLIAIRHSEPALTQGDFNVVSIDPGIAVITREYKGEMIVAVLNFSKRDQDDIEIPFQNEIEFQNELFGDSQNCCQGNACNVKNLKAVSATLFKVRVRH